MSRRREPIWRRYIRFFGPDLSADIDDEVWFHLAMRERHFMDQGMAPEQARAAARDRFGDPDRYRKTLRRQDGRRFRRERWWERFGEWNQDFRYAFRMLWHHRGFSAAVIATLALGIGATTAIFSAVDAALFRPLPFLAPDRLVELESVRVPFAMEGKEENDPEPSIRTVAAMPEIFSDVAIYAVGGFNLSGAAAPLRTRVGVVTPGFFKTLGAAPSAGRTFSLEEGRPNAGQVTVISHGLWQRQFGGNAAVGSSVRLNGKAYQIIGMMPASFRFPDNVDLWIPLSDPITFASFEAFRGYIPSTAVARLAPGISREVATNRMRMLWNAIPADRKQYATEAIAKPLTPLQGYLVGDRRTPILILLGATGLLLLIACVNVTNLLLAHAAMRERELTVRAVLGASRWRLVRQLLVQSLVLSFAGAAAGLLLAYASLGIVRSLLPSAMMEITPPTLDIRLLTFAIGIALITGLGFGILPALGAGNTDPQTAIKSGGGHGTTAGRRSRTRRMLVVAELALALMLLAGSGLMLRSFRAVITTDPGFRTDNVVSLQLALDRGSYPRFAQRLAGIERMLDRIRQIPGVEVAGAINDVPLGTAGGMSIRVTPEGPPLEGRIAEPYARYLKADGGYFRALGIPLLQGRLMTPADDSLAPRVAVIGAMMAHDLWPNQNPIGKRIQLLDRSGGFRTIVGVVGDVRERKLDQQAHWQMYYPVHEDAPEHVGLVVRGSLPKAQLLVAVREAIRELDPNQPVHTIRSLNDLRRDSVSTRRANTGLITAFGVLALMLAAVGVYGVVAYGVTLRSRELGIRAALGADRRALLTLVLREGLLVAVVGVAIGVAGALALSRVIRGLLYGVEPNDPIAMAGAALALLLPVIGATLIPARRASQANPVEVMRAD